jgi:hypothetical protein
MRFMVIAMATKESEGGPPPNPEAFVAMQMDVENFGEGFRPNPEIAKVKFK